MDSKLANTRKREVQTLQLGFSYRKISYELRKELIDLVTKQGSSVYKASKILKINKSTAKAIIRKFRKDGTIYLRKNEIEDLGQQQPVQDKPQAQEHAQEVLGQQQCDQKAAPEHNEAPFFYFYTMGLEMCYAFPTFSFANFF